MFFDVGMTDFRQTSDYNDQLDINNWKNAS